MLSSGGSGDSGDRLPGTSLPEEDHPRRACAAPALQLETAPAREAREGETSSGSQSMEYMTRTMCNMADWRTKQPWRWPAAIRRRCHTAAASEANERKRKAEATAAKATATLDIPSNQIK